MLVVADVLGTVGYFTSAAESRSASIRCCALRPPRKLTRLGARVVLVGHGEGTSAGDDASAAYRKALRMRYAATGNGSRGVRTAPTERP